jgi:glucarate dehydratase
MVEKTLVDKSSAPVVTEMRVIPVAGQDSMLMNLSGAHGPLFTRNIVILKDNAGHVGAGEVPGGERIRQTLEDAKLLVVGQSIAGYNKVLIPSARPLPTATAAGAACRHSTCA